MHVPVSNDLLFTQKMHVYMSEFLISSYGAPLAQTASYLALHSSLFGPDGAVICDYIVTNALTLC